MCECKVKTKVPAGSPGNFNYEVECKKRGRSKIFPITTTNDNYARQLAELECQEWNPAPIGGGGGCFLGDTLVLMADGTIQEIAQIREGDLVAGSSYFPGDIVPSPVFRKFVSSHSAVSILKLSSGESLVMSEKQPIATESGPVQAKHVLDGSRLGTANVHQTLRSSDVTVASTHSEVRKVELHSLELQNADFFFVGRSLMGVSCDREPRRPIKK